MGPPQRAKVVKTGRNAPGTPWSKVRPSGYLLLALAWGAWLYVLHPCPHLMYMGFYHAFFFSAIEFAWHGLSTEYSDGTILFTPFAKTCRRPHTTFAQFWVNLLFAPFYAELLLSGLYHWLFCLAVGEGLDNPIIKQATIYPLTALFSGQAPAGAIGLGFLLAFVRIAFHPIVIWILEVAEGHFLMAIFGRNPAWDYSHCSDSWFNGTIRKAHWKLWVGLGLVHLLANFRDTGIDCSTWHGPGLFR